MKNKDNYIRQFNRIAGALDTFKLAPFPKCLKGKGWEDTSWNQDEKPSFTNAALRVVVWVGFLGLEDDMVVYNVSRIDKHGETVDEVGPIDSNNVEHVDGYITALMQSERAAKKYARAVRVEQIARAFSAKVAGYVGKRAMRQINALNAKEQSRDICHSHDFCDANIFMGAAFQEVTGYNMAQHPNTLNIKLLKVWADAWNLAKNSNFFSK